KDNGDKFTEDEKKQISEKIDALREALKGEDINLIKNRQDELTKKFYELSERLYKEAAAQAQQQQQGNNTGSTQSTDNYQETPYTDVDNE
ncbi:MAG TPA: molecular chaperone DnaK, partial [Clostridiales bacterium]|nr:molecular chaperone DnaK [Clostridiales bacterium]